MSTLFYPLKTNHATFAVTSYVDKVYNLEKQTNDFTLRLDISTAINQEQLAAGVSPKARSNQPLGYFTKLAATFNVAEDTIELNSTSLNEIILKDLQNFLQTAWDNKDLVPVVTDGYYRYYNRKYYEKRRNLDKTLIRLNHDEKALSQSLTDLLDFKQKYEKELINNDFHNYGNYEL